MAEQQLDRVANRLNHRWYDPEIGRFISEDPIKDGLSWYAYCGNNPINFIDPSGLFYYTENGQQSSIPDVDKEYDNATMERERKRIIEWNKLTDALNNRDTTKEDISAMAKAYSDKYSPIAVIEDNTSTPPLEDPDVVISIIQSFLSSLSKVLGEKGKFNIQLGKSLTEAAKSARARYLAATYQQAAEKAMYAEKNFLKSISGKFKNGYQALESAKQFSRGAKVASFGLIAVLVLDLQNAILDKDKSTINKVTDSVNIITRFGASYFTGSYVSGVVLEKTGNPAAATAAGLLAGMTMNLGVDTFQSIVQDSVESVLGNLNKGN